MKFIYIYFMYFNNIMVIRRHFDMYNIIFQDGIESVFPNVSIMLLMFLTLMVTSCSGERSLSHLKRIKKRAENHNWSRKVRFT